MCTPSLMPNLHRESLPSKRAWLVRLPGLSAGAVLRSSLARPVSRMCLRGFACLMLFAYLVRLPGLSARLACVMCTRVCVRGLACRQACLFCAPQIATTFFGGALAANSRHRLRLFANRACQVLCPTRPLKTLRCQLSWLVGALGLPARPVGQALLVRPVSKTCLPCLLS